MASVHTYTASGQWTGDRFSVGRITAEGLSEPLSIPANLGGPGVGTNPEALLLAAANGCYLITLSKLLHNRGIPFLRIDVTSEGRIEHDGGLRMDEIVHRPTVVVEHADDEARILVLAEHAEHACMVSSALRGNVTVRVEPQVRVQAAQA